MNIADKTQFAQLLELTAEMYDKQVNQAMLQIYWHALTQYPFEAVRKGFNAHIQNPDWPIFSKTCRYHSAYYRGYASAVFGSMA